MGDASESEMRAMRGHALSVHKEILGLLSLRDVGCETMCFALRYPADVEFFLWWQRSSRASRVTGHGGWGRSGGRGGWGRSSGAIGCVRTTHKRQ